MRRGQKDEGKGQKEMKREGEGCLRLVLTLNNRLFGQVSIQPYSGQDRKKCRQA